MIIGFDASRAFINKRSGTENYSYQLLNVLTEIDKGNQYFVYVQGLTQHSTTVSNYVNWPKNFKVIQINWPRLWTQGGLALQTFKDKLDVLFIPAHTLPLIRKPALKTVMTVHDLGAEYLPQMHQLKQNLYLKWITKFQLRGATKLIAVSKATKDDLIKRAGIDSSKIEVIYEGYDKEKFKNLASLDASRSGQNSKIKIDVIVNILKQYDLVSGQYFLFVGTVQPRKNLERVIKAFSVIPPNGGIQLNESRSELDPAPKSVRDDKIKLVIAGAKGWLSNEIYKLPKQLGVEEKVKFLGYVPEKDLPALYSGAIALVFPSLFEGFGLPILEAQACGCPVLTSNTSSMPEVAGKGAVLVNPYSVDDIVKGMRRIQNSEFRINVIKAGLENVKRFSWEKCARETLRVLENL